MSDDSNNFKRLRTSQNDYQQLRQKVEGVVLPHSIILQSASDGVGHDVVRCGEPLGNKHLL